MLEDEDSGLDSVEAAGPRRTGGFSIQSRGRLRLGGRLDRVLAIASRRMAGSFYRAEANTVS